MKRMLDETTNFLRLYIHHTGISEIPPIYHVWSCFSLIAACVADRVGFAKFSDRLLCPNLYTLLVGPSGIGKDEAIGYVESFVSKVTRINYYPAKFTAPHILDRLGKPFRSTDGSTVLQNTKLFLVTPELSFSVGKGNKADEFVKLMTALYTGKRFIQEGTRMHGEQSIERPCLNWLGGTTREWLFESVSKEAIVSGFFARIAYIEADYDFNKRYVNIIYPPDKVEITEWLQQRVEELAFLEGEFRLTPEAQSIREAWYLDKAAPDDPTLKPLFRRRDDFVLKMAMILSLCDGNSLLIQQRHIIKAQQWWDALQAQMPGLMRAATTHEEGEKLELVRRAIEKRGTILKSSLLKLVGNRGITAEPLREIVTTLQQQGVIKQDVGLRGVTVFTWTGKRRGMKRVREEQDE